ncbi:late secretory pathway protein AVL9 homolog [Lucilia cuprina]|uniref:late secretory pathway protein AVL9 homolog n=1 Tax=Lucilia cuprina TaxID=7375 RepID=UPI001F06837F|nr:late secretory pathway protein AVL9 homolog [Lucilia cuprina]
MDSAENKPPILHILVVGFHHKLGCQVEFSYPPLVKGTTGKNECPSGWKYLSTLALPDGSHNFTEDTVFFNLPSLTDPTESVYGVSCYRQIPVERLKIRTADVTRSTVQKSVCCLARLPIYGYIEVKLALIADAFFETGDFSSTDLLVKAYQQLNACLLSDESRRPLRHFHVGLSLREIVLQWRHKTLQLFKLFLLQRRVVCFGSPVRNMCALILGISSLIPRLLEKGFQEVACVRTSRPLSPMPDYTESLIKADDCKEGVETALEEKEDLKTEKEEHILTSDIDSCVTAAVGGGGGGDSVDNTSCSIMSATTESIKSNNSDSSSTPTGKDAEASDASSVTNVSVEVGGSKRLERSNSFTRQPSEDTSSIATLTALTMVNPDEYRAPISIFASGNLCLPYLSLPYMDLLTDPSVLSYVIGTSNVLFQQKHHLSEVLVDIENGNLDIRDSELRKQLVLTTEDLRFMDFLLKHVHAPKEDAEGSEHWIRNQFQGYTLALLRTTVATDATSKDADHFNINFMNAFQKTQCFQEWFDVKPDTEFFEQLPAGHPFSGTLSVADMKLKLAQTMQNSESGRKINQAVNNTSRAVGGAISQAKGAFSYWWSSITTTPNNSASPSLDSGNATEAITTRGQEISVTFQNNSNEDKIEVGISVHTEEGVVYKKINENESNQSTPINKATNNSQEEKLIDSAEELMEENQLDKIKPNPNTNENQTINPETQPRRGIVEIGKEAEVLDKEDNKQNDHLNNCGAIEANDTTAATNTTTCTNGAIFIV